MVAPESQPNAIRGGSGQPALDHYQNVVVMRHGDRIDNFETLWASQSPRPWDPPLVEAGKARAFSTGAKLRSDLGFPIHRVFVSPFVRCVETAVQVVTALSSAVAEYESDNPAATDPSKIKVSIEYGLCEMLNTGAIRADVAPKDGQFGFKIADLEAMFPAGTIDQSVERLYKELPRWKESEAGARARYVQVFQDLADKYPSENLLYVTHAQGVRLSITAFLEGATLDEIEYCAYAELRRPITTGGKLKVMTNPGQTGISYLLQTSATDV